MVLVDSEMVAVVGWALDSVAESVVVTVEAFAGDMAVVVAKAEVWAEEWVAAEREKEAEVAAAKMAGVVVVVSQVEEEVRVAR